MSKLFKYLIDTYDSSQIIDYVERDELKDSLYETLSFKDKIHVAQLQLNDYLKQHKVLNFIFILPIKIQMVLFSILVWLSPAIILFLIGLMISHFAPNFHHNVITIMQSKYSNHHSLSEVIYVLGFIIIIISSTLTFFVTIWNIITFLGRGDRDFKDDNLYTLNGLKYVLLDDYMRDHNDEIYWVNYVKMHLIEFNEKILLIFMYMFKKRCVKDMIDMEEKNIVEYYNEPVLNLNKQVFRRHEVIKDVEKDDHYIISYNYIDSKMKSLSQLEKSKLKKQKLYYDSNNELSALKEVINEKQSSLYGFKMIVTKLAQLYKLNQIRLSDEKVKKDQQHQKEQKELEEYNKREVNRLVNELRDRQLTHEDQINEQIKHI